ncbi:MAG: ComF family protein [Bacteroidota bacterium]
MLYDLVSLFFPAYCLSCSVVLVTSEQWLCTACAAELPQTDYHLALDNPAAQKFYGRVPTTYVVAWGRYRKGNAVQKLVHQLKYKNKPAIGEALGKRYGLILSKMQWSRSFDWIVPVPLHARKLRQRGYNQSDYFARGLSASLAIPWHSQCLKRSKETDTQIQKGRIARLHNLAHAFDVTDSSIVQGKHILLVDDVITTGATLEACALSLLAVSASKISMAAIGVAE